MTRRMLLSGCLIAATAASATAGEPVVREHVTARLIARTRTVRPGTTATVGLHLKLDDGWHVYWRNPGESGLPPSIAWELPEGSTAGPLQWPVPRRIPMGPVLNFGYEGEVVFPVAIRVPADAHGSVTLRAVAEWLVCEETCIAGEAPLALELRVADTAPETDPEWDATLARAKTLLPQPAEPTAITHDDGSIGLALGTLGAGALDADFFPDEGSPVTLARPMAIAGKGGLARLDLMRSGVPTRRLRGVVVVVAPDGARAYEVDSVIDAGVTGPPDPTTTRPDPHREPAPGPWTVVLAVIVGAVCALVVLWRALAGTR